MAHRRTRVNLLLQYIDPKEVGIEVAPYFNPALPKSDGNSALILDVFDTETLRAQARQDPNIPDERINEIEPVDFVGDAGSIADMVAEKGLTGQLAYVVSSHNFEHLSNPIRFLQGCHAALKPGGVLSMAVPDARACFDIFRMPTRLIDWISAYHNDIRQPSAETLFDTTANAALYTADGKTEPGVALAIANPRNFEPQNSLRQAYTDYQARRNAPTDYIDAHCTVMIPETLSLMLHDLKHLGLIDFDILSISETRGHEFFIHLQKPLTPTAPQDEAPYLAERAAKLRDITHKVGAFGYLNSTNDRRRMAVIQRFKRGLQSIIGANLSQKLKAANRARKARSAGPK